MLWLKRKTPSEREREKLEAIEYTRRLQEEYKRASSGDLTQGGRDYSDPTWDAPCPLHPDFRVPHRKRLDVQPEPRFIFDCPYCRDERLTGRRRDLAREDEARKEGESAVAPDVLVRLDPGEAAWAEHRAAHPDEFLTSEDEQRALDLIDSKRQDEMVWNRLGPEEQRRRRRKSHRRYWARHAPI